jgi:hypothetical protein
LLEDELRGEGADLDGDGIPDSLSQSFWQRIPVWQTVTAVVILAIAGVLLYAANKFNLRVESDIGRSYTRLGSFIRPVHTPHERADLLTGVVPEGSGPIRSLTQQFVLRQFSPAQAAEPTFEPLAEWKLLRPLLLRKGITNRLSRVQPKLRRWR